MKINCINWPAITDAIIKTEKKCKQRLLDPERIKKALDRAEVTLENLGIPKKYWLECKIVFIPAKPPNSYKDTAEGTYAKIEKFASGWFMTECDRRIVYSTSGGDLPTQYLELSHIARANIPLKYWL